MSSSANPPRPADILAAHTETRTPTGSHCSCGEWQTVLFRGGPDIANWSWATHLLDVLKAAGFAVMKVAKARPEIAREHPGYCYPDCGCPDNDFDWDSFAADINGGHTP